MLAKFFYFVGIVLCSGLFGQTLDSNSITVSVSRSVTIPAEQAQFSVQVVSAPTVDLATVQSALNAAGLSSATFSGLTNTTTATLTGLSLIWNFNLQVPYSKLNDQFVILQKAAQTMKSGNPSLTLGFGLAGSSISDATVQDTQKKMLADLMSDARKRAAALADAAGVSVGQVLSLADIGSLTAGIYAATITNYPITGYISSGNASSTYTVTYGITVKFAALRYS